MSSLMSSNKVLCCDLSGSSAVNSQSKARNEHSSMCRHISGRRHSKLSLVTSHILQYCNTAVTKY